MTTAVRQATPGRALGAGRRTDGPVVRKDKLALGLGVFSLGLGAAQVAAPRAVERLVGIRDSPARRAVVRAVGVRELASGVGIIARSKPSGWLWARVAGDLVDLALLGSAAAAGDSRRGRVAAATGAVAGVTAPDVAAATRASRGGPTLGSDGIRVAQAVTVYRPPGAVYAFWRDLENLPRFTAHVDAVHTVDERRSRWTVRAPLGRRVEWEAEIVDERPGELISWRTLPGADVEHSGTVRFEEAPGERGTEVRVDLRYSPPAGGAGAAVAKLLGEEPEVQAYDDLRRFKQVVETGEVVRSEGSPAGVGLVQQLLQRAARPFDRERDSRAEPRSVAPPTAGDGAHATQRRTP